jgi:hypothetical protein
VVNLTCAPDPALQRRQRLRLIDACLAELEDAHERDEVMVSPTLAARLRPFLGGIEAGARIADMIDSALREQQQYLTGPAVSSRQRGSSARSASSCLHHRVTDNRTREPGRSPRVTCAQLDPRQARDLTERIKVGLEHVSTLLLHAHDGRAWTALGYSTWGEYVTREFRFTKQRSFQLLDHARFVRALEDAAGRSTAVDLPERVSRDLKPYREEVVEAVRTRASLTPEDSLPAVVRSVVGEQRRRVLQLRSNRAERPSSPPPPGRHSASSAADPRADHAVAGVDIPTLVSRLCDAIDTLAHMPPPTEVVDVLQSGVGDRLVRVGEAARWLTSFASAWDRATSVDRRARGRHAQSSTCS